MCDADTWRRSIPILAARRRSGPPGSPRTWSSGGALAALGALVAVARHQRRVDPAEDHVGGDHAAAHVVAGGQVVLDVEQDLFQDRAQPAGAGAAQDRLVGHGIQGVVGELQLDPVELEELAVLLDQGVLGLDEDADQGLLVQGVDRADHRQATDELRDEPEFQQVLGEHLGEDLADVLVADTTEVGSEADPLAPDAGLDDLLEPRERAAADEQHVGGVDLDELLVGMLAAALRRDAGGGPLQDLQQGLLHALAGDVAGDRRVLALAGDLVDLVDVDDPSLGLLDVVADVAGLGEGGGVGDREGHVEHPGERLRQQRLPAAGGAEQDDVGLLQLDVAGGAGADLDALVVVVDRDRQDLLGLVLADHVVVDEVVDLPRLWQLVELQLGGLRQLLFDDLVAEVDARVADVDTGAGDQLLDLLLRLAAEGAFQQVAAVPELGHLVESSRAALPAATVVDWWSVPARWDRPPPAIPGLPRVGERDQLLGRGSALDDLVDDAVLLGLRSGHDEVAVGVVADLVDILAGVGGEDLVQHAPHA